MDMVHCHGCGKQLHKTALGCPGCGARQQVTQHVRNGAVGNTSKNWYLEVLKKYATFSGRAGRKEYWYFILFNVIIAAVVGLVSGASGLGSLPGNLYNLAVLLPSIAVGVRRLHDTGRSGWWLILPIANIIFLAQGGHAGSNLYGDDPKAS